MRPSSSNTIRSRTVSSRVPAQPSLGSERVTRSCIGLITVPTVSRVNALQDDLTRDAVDRDAVDCDAVDCDAQALHVERDAARGAVMYR
jgi:hypothetical protein